MSLLPLNGRVALVTGGARGIGAAIARELSADGAHVAITGLARDRTRAQSLRASLNGAAARLSFHESDVGEYEECRRVIAQVLGEHGRIDYLVNNAGITADKTVMKMTLEAWHAVLRVNLCGPFYMTKSVLDHMVERRFGRIVNMSSVVGLTGNFGQANYAASKAGLLGLTKTVAREVARFGITVNAVAPGFIATDMVAAMPKPIIEATLRRVPQQRLGTPEEVARLVRFLVDDTSAYLTGAVVNINGGWYM